MSRSVLDRNPFRSARMLGGLLRGTPTRRFPSFAAAILVVPGLVLAASPLGAWKTIDDKTGRANSVVRIVSKGERLEGAIESVFLDPGEAPNPLCKACEGGNKNKPITGMQIMWDLRKDGDSWTGGRILDPDNGVVYRCRIRLLGENKLEVRGYVGISLFGRSQVWVRE